ncbi:MAG: archease [Nitrospirae bacterium]|nr:archease [Nitrospirota bacterium]
MKKIEQIDISGDVGLRVYGKSIEELFENAATGMVSLMTNPFKINETEQREISLKVETYENTLVQWLNELVFLFDTYGFTGKVFSVSLKDDKFRASVSGGTFDPERNEQKLLIKAATYHNLSVKQTDSRWEATVIFDI